MVKEYFGSLEGQSNNLGMPYINNFRSCFCGLFLRLMSVGLQFQGSTSSYIWKTVIETINASSEARLLIFHLCSQGRFYEVLASELALKDRLHMLSLNK